jgi:hypothetical protein
MINAMGMTEMTDKTEAIVKTAWQSAYIMAPSFLFVPKRELKTLLQNSGIDGSVSRFVKLAKFKL